MIWYLLQEKDRRTVSLCESTTSTLTAASDDDDLCRSTDDELEVDGREDSGSDTDSVASIDTQSWSKQYFKTIYLYNIYFFLYILTDST